MNRRRRGFDTFSVSFIDCMSCGLGAVVLLFMVIKHASEVHATQANREVASRVSQLESQVLDERRAVESLNAVLKKAQETTEAAQSRAVALATSLNSRDSADDGTRERQARVAVLQDEVKAMQARLEDLRAQAAEGDATRNYVGQGNRQYLTGLKVGGRHILILVDASASMLDQTIVNIIRRRNMDDTAKRASAKWRRAVDTVDWITTQVPAAARFQIYAFNTQARPVLGGTADQWLRTDGGSRLTAAVRALNGVVPGGGTNLQQAFAAADRLSPRPDNIYLITDSLPTQGATTHTGTVSGDERLAYYREALDILPPAVPVNVILFPMEGDPLAASVFWQLAQVSGGAFLSPAGDWP
jgi:hypothetical protein